MIRTLRIARRLPGIVVHLLLGAVAAATLLHATERSGWARRRRLGPRLVRWWHGRLARLLRLDLRVTGSAPPHGTLLVANHISWLDIIGLGAVSDGVFLSKREVRTWPVIGWLAQRAGTLFICRGAEDGAGQAADSMTWQLLRGTNVIVFPEGTSGTGDTVMRFYPRLFQSAIRAQSQVQAVALRYPLDGKTHPAAPFVGNDNLLRHLLDVLGDPGMVMEITFFAPLPARESTRQALAQHTHAQVRAVVEGVDDDRQANASSPLG